MFGGTKYLKIVYEKKSGRKGFRKFKNLGISVGIEWSQSLQVVRSEGLHCSPPKIDDDRLLLER